MRNGLIFMGDSLIDTNIMVYAFDVSEPAKREKCKKIVELVFNGEKKAFVTNQVLAEFFFVLTEKIEKPVDIDETKKIIDGIIESDNWIKADYTSKTVQRAINTSNAFKAEFWDALIAETMLENSVFEIITENSRDFEKIPKISVKNPLK